MEPAEQEAAAQGREDPLREAFVEMLFALVVSQVAIYAADLTSVSSTWFDELPSIAHLGVGLLLISTSWVGWRQSVSPGMKERIRYVFSRPFVGLLLDVSLVVLYFIVVRTVEIQDRGGAMSLAPPSAQPEAWWIGVVFAVYVMWDLLSDVLCEGGLPQGGIYAKLKKGLAAAIVSTFASLVCLLGSFGIWWLAATRTGVIQIVFLDLSLVCIILLFRVLKAAENALAPMLKVTDCKAFANPRPTRGTELATSVGLLFLLLLCVLVVTR
jgi:hypothetical protein